MIARLIPLVFVSLLSLRCSPAPVAGDVDWLAAAKAKIYLPADRAGIACCAIWLISDISDKDTYNASFPVDDISNHKTKIRDLIVALRADVASIVGAPAADGVFDADAAASSMVPDVVTIDTATDSGFPNGRLLEDSAVDTLTAQLFDRSTWTDGVTNTNEFLEEFPFLSAPQTDVEN